MDKLQISAFRYLPEKLSLKISNQDIDFSRLELNKLFESIDDGYDTFLFEGQRPVTVDANGNSIDEYLFSKVFLKEKHSFNLLAEVKHANIFINRLRLTQLWQRFEYAALIFTNSDAKDEIIQTLRSATMTYENVVSRFLGTIVIFKNIEYDVLWILSSNVGYIDSIATYYIL